MFLKAIGLGLAAPIAFKLATHATAARSERPRRLFVLFIPHGMPVEHFDPAAPAGALDLAAAPGLNILDPLIPYQAQMNLLRGIEYKGHSNHSAIRAALTNGAGASLEHVVATKLGISAVDLGAVPWRPNDFGPDSQLLHDGTDWVRPEPNPVKASESLLANINSDSEPEQGPSDADFRRAALELTIGEVEALRSELNSLTDEESKLSTHLESLQALKEPGGSAGDAMGCDSQPSTPAIDAVGNESAAGTNGAYFIDKSNFSQIYAAQLELAAYSLLCGSARVMALQTMFANAQVSFSFMGLAKDHHDPLSHSIDLPAREEFAQAQKWLIQTFVDRFLKVLDQPDPEDPEHTMLDNTLIYITSEIADGNAHNCNKARVWIGGEERTTYLPIMTLGGGSGSLRTGRLLEFENRPHADLLMTVCHAMGATVPSFGPNSGSVIEELLA